MLTLVLRDGCMPLPTAARGILLTANAVRHLLLPDVQPTMASVVPVLLPVPIPADTPVINVAMTTVRPEHLKVIPVLFPDTQNAELPAIDVRVVLPAVRLIPVLMSGLPNAVPAMLVTIPANQVKNPFLALRKKQKRKFQRRNAEQLVIPVKAILIVR